MNIFEYFLSQYLFIDIFEYFLLISTQYFFMSIFEYFLSQYFFIDIFENFLLISTQVEKLLLLDRVHIYRGEHF